MSSNPESQDEPTVGLREAIESIKHRAVTKFKNDHDDGDIAIYDVVQEMAELYEQHIERIPKPSNSGGLEMLIKIADGEGWEESAWHYAKEILDMDKDEFERKRLKGDV